jgi:hypothetical protein
LGIYVSTSAIDEDVVVDIGEPVEVLKEGNVFLKKYSAVLF